MRKPQLHHGDNVSSLSFSLFHVVEEVYAADPFYWDPCVQVKDLTGQVQRNAWPDRFALNSTTVSQNTHYA